MCAVMYDKFFSKSLERMPTKSAVNTTVYWLRTHNKKAYLRQCQLTILKKPLHLPLGLTAEYSKDEYVLSILKSFHMYV